MTHHVKDVFGNCINCRLTEQDFEDKSFGWDLPCNLQQKTKTDAPTPELFSYGRMDFRLSEPETMPAWPVSGDGILPVFESPRRCIPKDVGWAKTAHPKCETCQHWTAPSPNACAENALFGECNKTPHNVDLGEWDFEYPTSWVMKPEYEDVTATAHDGSGYSAGLSTKPEHYCSMHKPLIQEDEFARECKEMNRVTLENVHDEVLSEAYHVFPETQLTICCLTLQNGFTVTGESACADPNEFDETIGRKIAMEKALDKVWMLLGFRLKDKLHSGDQG